MAAPFGTYELDLRLTEDELWKGLHSKHRNVIRNAEKKGGEVRSGIEEVNTFYQLYVETMNRNGMFFEPLSYFKELVDIWNKHIYCAVVYSNGEPQGAVFVPYSNEGAYYVYGASAEKITLTGAVNYLHYQLILELKERGVNKYDFVGARLSDVSGTRLEGIQKFKSRFGGALKEGLIWKMDINPSKCRIYDIALKTKLKLKGLENKGDIIDQERRKYKQ